MQSDISKLKTALQAKEFPITVELVPGRGSREKWFDKLMSFVEDAERDARVACISITDHPSGIGSMSPVGIAAQFSKYSNLEPLVHVSAKDLSRNGLEGYIYSLDRIGVRSLLLLTGDYPTTGFGGISRPVFDLDSVWMTRMVSEMNGGLPDRKSPKTGEWVRLGATHFFKGAAVSPFKNTEEELLHQYWKLNRKILGGADFIVPQLGYDMRKFHELLKVIRSSEDHIYVLGNVYVPTLGAAKAMNKGNVPGAYISSEMIQKMETEAEAPDKGRAARITRAAKMIAVLRGIGYDGIHLGGYGITYKDVVDILSESDSYSANWKEYLKEVSFPDPNAYYLFTEDTESGLNTDRLVKPAVGKHLSLNYTSMALGHKILFDAKSPVCKMLRSFCKKLKPNGLIEEAIGFAERLIKSAFNHCKECGDCALPNTAFLCPVSQCPKIQRNGPCGGSRDGWCEVFPNQRLCVWVRAYRRLGAERAEREFSESLIPPRNYDLDQTPSWINYYAERDHISNYGVAETDRPPSALDTDSKTP